MNSQILRAAKAVIETPSTWCRGARAKNIDGRDVPVMSDSAVTFCSKGAIYYVVGSESVDISEAEVYLNKAMTKGTDINYVGFNERYPHEDVMEMFDVAIAKAELDESKFGGLPSNKQLVQEFFTK